MRMRSSVVVGMITAAAAWSSGAGAQTAAVDSTPYVRARDMVSNGEVEQGRQLVDSLLKAASTGTPQYAEGLYWRAVTSQNARDAERDYRQVVVDYPLSARVPDALLRLGQLEAARGDRDAALQHFQRIVLEYPDSPRRPEASYWVANTYLSRNDLQRGCTANADALARVTSANVELKNRIDFQQLRCRGIQLKGAPAPVVASAPSSVPTSVPTSVPAPVAEKRTSSTREVPVAESRVGSPVAADTSSASAESAATASTATTNDATGAAHAERVSATTAPKTARSTKVTAQPKPVTTSGVANSANATSAAESTTRVPSSRANTTTTTGRGYVVQVAAYTSRAQADALAARLRARGYASHVDGDSAPYRVRIGHYRTRADAAAELKQLKARKIDGFITEP